MINFSRKWAMPNKETFLINPINKLIHKYLTDGIWIDPFVRDSFFKKRMTFTNDLNPSFNCTHNMDALDFLKTFQDSSIDGLLFDPPYSPRQITECYQNIGRKTTMQDTQSKFWGDLKKEISRILKHNGFCISFGWNSGGIGMCNNFKIVEILLVAHGGWHNDTICTVETKFINQLSLF